MFVLLQPSQGCKLKSKEEKKQCLLTVVVTALHSLLLLVGAWPAVVAFFPADAAASTPLRRRRMCCLPFSSIFHSWGTCSTCWPCNRWFRAGDVTILFRAEFSDGVEEVPLSLWCETFQWNYRRVFRRIRMPMQRVGLQKNILLLFGVRVDLSIDHARLTARETKVVHPLDPWNLPEFMSSSRTLGQLWYRQLQRQPGKHCSKQSCQQPGLWLVSSPPCSSDRAV